MKGSLPIQQIFLAVLALAFISQSEAASARQKVATEKVGVASASEQVRELPLRGRVVCLPELMHQKHDGPLPTNHEHIWGFQTETEVLYTLLRGKFSEAIFL